MGIRLSYSLGQAKLVPGQVNFMTTRTGRTMSLQPLIEAGLPIAPYIEHGSWEFGQPAIMRYGLDPYRGLSAVSPAPMPAPVVISPPTTAHRAKSLWRSWTLQGGLDSLTPAIVYGVVGISALVYFYRRKARRRQ